MIPATTFVRIEMSSIMWERRDWSQSGKSMQRVTNQALFQHLDKTIASVLFEENTYPWEVLPKIHDFILEVGMLLSKEEYECITIS